MLTTKNNADVIPHDAKWTFSTRRVKPEDVCGLTDAFAGAMAGDLLLCRVTKIGQHQKLQLASGRYSATFTGDVAVLCVGNRYAPDQFEGIAEIDQRGCHLIAGGGVAGKVVQAHSAMSAPTQLKPIGLLTDNKGDVINIACYGLAHRSVPDNIMVIGVFGTAMNSGKTTTATSLAHGLLKAGYRVAGIKATGTGAFGDFNAFRDAGVAVTDFTDAGMPTTYKMPLERIEQGFETLVGQAATAGAEIAVVEFADGVFQGETHEILKGSPIMDRVNGMVFAAFDSAGAAGSVAMLRAMGHEPICISGLVSCSPLASQEATSATGTRVLTRDQLRNPSLVQSLIVPALDGSDGRYGVAA